MQSFAMNNFAKLAGVIYHYIKTMKTTKYQKNNACAFDEFKKEIKKENKNHKNFRDLRKNRRNMWQD